MAAGDVKVGITTNKALKCAIFDGVDDYISVGSATAIDNIFSNGGSVSFWVNARNGGEGDSGRIYDKSNLIIRLTGTVAGKSKISITRVHSVTSGIWTSTATEVTNNQWTNIIIVYDDSSVDNNPAVYVNGTAIAMTETQAPAGTASSDAAATGYLGNNSATTATFFGGMTNIKFYKFRVLTSTEISQLAQGLKIDTFKQVAEWNFQNGTYQDSIGTNHGTNSGTTITIMDSDLAKNIKAQRVGANDKWLVFKSNDNQVGHIEIEG